jgi:hypothetical protein
LYRRLQQKNTRNKRWQWVSDVTFFLGRIFYIDTIFKFWTVYSNFKTILIFFFIKNVVFYF